MDPAEEDVLTSGEDAVFAPGGGVTDGEEFNCLGRGWTLGHHHSITPLGGRKLLGKSPRLLLLFECLGFGAVGILYGGRWPERVLLWFSLSAAAILLERVTNREPKVPVAPFAEDPAEEKHNVILREKEGTNAHGDSRSPGRSLSERFAVL